MSYETAARTFARLAIKHGVVSASLLMHSRVTPGGTFGHGDVSDWMDAYLTGNYGS